MVDPKTIRENPQKFIDLINLGRGNFQKADINKWLELDAKRKLLISQRDELNKQKNNLASIGRENPELVREKGKEIKQKLETVENELKEVETTWQEILDWIPNLPLDDVPIGEDSTKNVEIKAWHPEVGYFEKEKLGLENFSLQYMPRYGTQRDKDFEPLPHWDLGTNLGLLDLEAGAKVSGSRFYYLTGYGVLLVNGVFNLLSKKLLTEGFVPFIPPILVRNRALYGSSHFPGDADQVYKLASDYLEDQNELYLIGSSEPSNFAYFMDRVLDLSSDIKIMAQTMCFRSEVGSWGKDVRGIKRSHQFEKLEMNIITKADLQKSKELHEYLLSLNEWLLQTLQIPYHVINMCIGDLGYYAAAKKYDIEFWSPSQNTYIEIMSNSITTDYQSRRLNIKYRDENGELKYVYTLNDTGVTHRILIAILDHYQQSDGSLLVPEAIRDYVGIEKIATNILKF